MKLQDVTRTDRKTVVMTIRTTPEISVWMRKLNIKPSKVFEKAIEDLQKQIAEEGLHKLARPR